jgi:hypothetical protein
MIENQTVETDSKLNNHLGLIKLSPDIWLILGALSQLERELIRERVRAGLAAARQKGKLIGRKKLRDSDLIRKLLKNGLSYRAIAAIAKTSHGSVHAELVALRREEAAAREKEEKEKAEKQKALDEKEEVERKLNAILQGPTSDKTHFVASSVDSKDG